MQRPRRAGDAERLRRMRECWKADAPSDFEIAVAERRIIARTRDGRRRSGTDRRVVELAAIGALLGGALMFAIGTRGTMHSAPTIDAEPLPAAATTQAPSEPALAEPIEPPAPPPMPDPTSTPPRVAPKPPAKAPSASSEPGPSKEPASVGSERDRAELERAELWVAVGGGKDGGGAVV